MSWHDGLLLGVDFETTGVDPANDRIVTAAATYWRRDGSTRHALTWLSDVDGVEIPAKAAEIHGIDTEAARSAGRPARDVVMEVVWTLAGAVEAGVPIVAMNANFDLTMLEAEARRHGVRSLFSRCVPYVLDPRVLDKHVDPYRRGRRTLTDLCAHYRVGLVDAHSADADAQAACGVVWEIAARHEWLTALSLETLHEDQVRWAKDQNTELRAHFEATPSKRHLAAGVRLDWPIDPAWPASAGERP